MSRTTLLIAFFGSVLSAFSQSYTIQTLAGGGLPVNRPGISADLGFARGLATDSAGNIYIALADLNAIIKLDAAGNLTLAAGTGDCGFGGDGGPAKTAQLCMPDAIAVDRAGNLYIADTGNQRIRVVPAATGVISTLSTSVSCPFGLALGKGLAAGSGQNPELQDTELYVADACKNQIIDISLPGGSSRVVAGTGVAGFGGDGGPAAAAVLNNPYAIAVDSVGNKFVSDCANSRVRKIDANSGVITTIATGVCPYSFAVDSADNVYSVDRAGLVRFSANGPTQILMSVNGYGVAVGPAKELYVSAATSSNRFIVGQAVNGSLVTLAGGGTDFGDLLAPTSAQFNNPVGVAANASAVFVADSGDGRVRKVANGTVTTVAGSTVCCSVNEGGAALQSWLPGVQSIALDAVGNVYIGGGHSVRKVDHATGIISTVVGSPEGGCGALGDGGPATAACVASTSGLAVNSGGDLYIADWLGNRVRKVSARTGVITTVAGDGVCGSGPDGLFASASELCQPEGVSLDSAGNLYIADLQNSRIVRVDAVTGILTTAVGTGSNGNRRDGVDAKSATLGCPYAITFDAADNLYFSDRCYFTVSRVDHASRIVNTIAGSDVPWTGGDDGLATHATLGAPVGLATDSAGRVYIADAPNNRIRVLTPTGESQPGASCSSVTLVPNLLQIGAEGGTLTISVSAPTSTCGWSVSNLPAWITANPASATGNQSIILTVTANTGNARSGSVSVNGATVSVYQSPAPALCGYAINPSAQSVPSSGGSGSITVTAGLGCPWKVTAAPPWITWNGASSGTGDGSVSFIVAANAGAPRSASFQIAKLAARVDQNGAAEAVAAVMGHFAAGAGWQTTFTLVNPGYLAAHGHLGFFDDNGGAITTQYADRLINAGAVFKIDAPAGVETSQTGWAQLFTDGNVSGFGTFRLPTSSGIQEAVVLAESRNSTSYILPFDNTNGYFYGVAISNLALTSEAIDVVVRDASSGNVIDTTQIRLGALAHEQFLLHAQFPRTADISGTVEFNSSGLYSGSISVLGLRFNANNAFTSVPVFVHGTQLASAPLANAGAIAHLAFGGGWTTQFTLVNTGSFAARAQLSFFDDNGNALALPMSLPLSPGTTVQASPTFSQTLAPGAMVLVECASPSSQTGQTGWAQLQTNGNVTGSAVFRYTTDAVSQEAAVPLAAPGVGGSLVAFDNTDGYTNGIALANNSSAAARVPVIIRDPSTGDPLSTDALQLPAWGHTSFILADRYPATAGRSGTIEFGASTGQIAVLGLRVNSSKAFTSVPPVAR